MKIIFAILIILSASIAAAAQDVKQTKKDITFNIATSGFSIAGAFYDWKQANKHAGEQIAPGTYRCEGNGLYRSGPCYQSNAKYWGVNGGLIAFTSILKYKLGVQWHLLGDTLDIGFGTIHFVAGRRWNTNLQVIGKYANNKSR